MKYPIEKTEMSANFGHMFNIVQYSGDTLSKIFIAQIVSSLDTKYHYEFILNQILHADIWASILCIPKKIPHVLIETVNSKYLALDHMTTNSTYYICLFP